jgi:hypothetical protein
MLLQESPVSAEAKGVHLCVIDYARGGIGFS